MSSANPVPETTGLTTGERPTDMIRSVGAWPLLRDAFERLRVADGFSHSRAMAFQLVLALIPGTIALVALASELRWESLSNAIIRSVESLAPGPSAEVFREAFGQGEDAGTTGWTALVVAGPALLVAGTTAFGQVERTANRIYGVEADRPSRRKYTVAALMMLSAGTLAVLYFLVVGLGGSWIGDVGESPWATAWWIGRWPIGLGLLSGAMALVFKLSPRRSQPPIAWLAFGALVGVAGSLVVTVLLSLYLTASEGFGQTYGPLAGFMGVLLWSYASSIAMFYGLACAAQLEAYRAGVAAPRADAKVDESEPDAVVVPYGTAAMHPGGSR